MSAFHSRLRAAAVVCAIALAMPATVGAQTTPEPQTTLPDIEDEVMCVVCGTTLELASENQQAQDVREQIRTLIAEGRTKDEIKDELVAEFGEEVLATPSTEGFDLAAWIVPGLAVVVGGGVILVGLRRWRAAAAAEPEPAPLSAESDSDRARLDADLKRYEL